LPISADLLEGVARTRAKIGFGHLIGVLRVRDDEVVLILLALEDMEVHRRLLHSP
jgi:hypothetical protein